MHCPRCQARVHQRTPQSLSFTWAFLLAAVFLYVPANVLPVMQASSLLGRQDDTIISGVIYLWRSGSWPLALIVFVASVLVPLAKMLALGFLALSVQLGSTRWSLERARLYRLTAHIGRWSMVDIFVVALLVGVVHLQGVAVIQAGPGAIAFGVVVVLTMAATRSFDPRLIWDASESAAPHLAHPGETEAITSPPKP